MSKLAIISCDGHAKASRRIYRDYVSSEYLDAYDAWRTSMEGLPDAGNKHPGLPEESQWDSDVRLADLDAQGVVGEVLFPNGLPFSGALFQDAQAADDPGLAREGRMAYNRWLVDFCDAAPGRRAGQMVVSFDDVDQAVRDVYWAKEHGLRGIMMPPLLPGSTFFFDPGLDSIWRACQEVGLPLNQHGGAGLPAYQPAGFAALITVAVESSFFSGRSLWQMIVGGVFERFPGLTFVLTETMADWIPGTLRYLDGLASRGSWAAFARHIGREPTITKRPSEYWALNCYAASSPACRDEYAMRYEVGVDRMMFGVDYPHFETIWPDTKKTVQATLGSLGVPEHEARLILMETAADIFGFDLAALAADIERVGVDSDELLAPPADEVDGDGSGPGTERLPRDHAPLHRSAPAEPLAAGANA